MVDQSIVPNAPPINASRLPLWQRRLIASVQYGIPVDEALLALNTSRASLDRWTSEAPAFAAALAAAEAGVAVLGVEAVRQLAVARAAHIAEHMARTATNTGVRPRDQVQAARLVLDVAGVTGQQVAAPDAAWDVAQGLHQRLRVLIGVEVETVPVHNKGDSPPTPPARGGVR